MHKITTEHVRLSADLWRGVWGRRPSEDEVAMCLHLVALVQGDREGIVESARLLIAVRESEEAASRPE